MPVFKETKLAPLKTQLEKLFGRMVGHHVAPPLSVERIYKSLVRPEHLAALRQADEVCGVIQRHSSAHTMVALPGGQLASVTICFMSTPLARLLPAYVTHGFHEQADPELRETVTAWMLRRYQIGVGFSLAMAAFREANNLLGTASQMRIYFPGVLTLMSNCDDEVLRDKATKLVDAAVPSSLPSLAPELRRALMDATKLIARAVLLPPETPATPDIVLGCGAGQLGSIELPWRPDYYIDVE